MKTAGERKRKVHRKDNRNKIVMRKNERVCVKEREMTSVSVCVCVCCKVVVEAGLDGWLLTMEYNLRDVWVLHPAQRVRAVSPEL